MARFQSTTASSKAEDAAFAGPSAVAGPSTQCSRRCPTSPRRRGDDRHRQKATVQEDDGISLARDLTLGSSAPAKMLVWLHAIALGRKVVEVGDSRAQRQFVPAMEQIDAKLRFATSFRSKHAHLHEGFTALLTSRRDSKWKSTSRPQKGAFDIRTPNDIRLFLMSVQRVPSGSLSFSGRARPPRRR